MIYAWTGEKDLALEQLAATVRIPGVLTVLMSAMAALSAERERDKRAIRKRTKRLAEARKKRWAHKR